MGARLKPEVHNQAAGYAEVQSLAEDELREALLSEFLKLKSGWPAPIELLRHCERYLIRLFDATAEGAFSRPLSEYRSLIGGLRDVLPKVFFGLALPFNNCMEYVMLACVDHGGRSDLTEREFFEKYLNGGEVQNCLFLKYSLRSRANLWISRREAHDRTAPPSPVMKRGRPPQTIEIDDGDALTISREARGDQRNATEPTSRLELPNAEPARVPTSGATGRVGPSPVPDDDEQPDFGKAAKKTRAETVAKVIRELDKLKPQMFEDESEYNKLRAQNPTFISFQIAEQRPDLKRKILAIQGSTRHIMLAQELAAAHYGRQLSTIQDDWKDHKPAEFRRRK
jgi:hypothetical protein